MSTGKDPYLYDKSEVLINKLCITDINLLNEAESDYTSTRLRELEEHWIKGIFDFDHLKKIHQYIFQDIFEWAGEIRIINIEKPEVILKGLSVDYSSVENIKKDMQTCLIKLNSLNWSNMPLEEKVDNYSRLLACIWKIHPFREGNTRSIIMFLFSYADENGIMLNKNLLSDNSEYVRGALVAASFNIECLVEYNYDYLKAIIRDAMSTVS